MIKKILVAQDGSLNSKAALECALWLAEKFGAEVTGLYVVDKAAMEGPFLHDLSGSLGFEPFLNFSVTMKESLEATGKAVLDTFSKRCEEAGVASSTELAFGVVVGEISERANVADLLVVGKRGVNAKFEYGMLGSVTEGLIRRSPRPVIIVSEEFIPPSKPLLAYDGSEFAAKTMRSAAEFSKTLSLPLTVLSVGTVAETDAFLGEARDYLKPYSVETDFVALKGDGPEEIEKYYNDNDHDLLFMGPSHHSRLVSMVLGSTTEHVMRAVRGPFFLER